MQSCCFFVFFSRPFQENFKFLKNSPYDFHEILHTHSTLKGAPACAKESKSYNWHVRNIAKISPKMARKQPFFDFFRFSQKLSIRFERNFLQLFYTILESYMCNGITSKLYDWDVRNIAKISPYMAKKQPFSDFFRFSQKLSIRFERNFLQLFYTILESYMFNGMKIVWLGCEKHRQNLPKNGQKTVVFRLFSIFSKNCPYDSNEIFYSHSTPYYGPFCAFSLNSYGWDLRNIAKLSPKMAKKTVIFWFFRYSHKLFIPFERKRVRRKKT